MNFLQIAILKVLKSKLILKLLDISKASSMIQRLNSYNLPTNKKGLKKWLEQFTDQMKKGKKKYWKVGIELSINGNTKIPQIYTLPQFLSMSEKNCGIYWLDSHNLLTSKNGLKSSKQLKIIFPFMSVLNTFQYKQCLYILTLPKCNT